MTATLLPNGKQSFVNSAGVPLVGGKLYTYDAGTNNPRATYSDAAGTVPNTNPIILDARGEATVFWSGSYKAVLKDAASVTIWTVDGIVSTDTYSSTAVGALTVSLASSAGGTFVGWIQAGVGAIFRWVRDKLRERVSIADFGAVGDGVTDDTAAIQAAINYVGLAGSPKKLIIPYGAAGIYKITSGLFINVGAITIEWENNNIQIKKFYNGAVFIVLAGLVKFVNPGINGNGAAGYTGSGIYFGDTPTYFTYDCSIINPHIFGTKDSCLLFLGPRGGSGLVVTGGSMLTYNPSGLSSGGYPSARITGAQDGDVTPRIFNGVSSSSQVLIDVTGMWVTRISDCFTGSIFFKGNPDVTGIGAPYSSCAETFISNTYIRDGMTISGSEVLVDNCLTHGVAPLYSVYGGGPTSYATYGWKITSDSIACHMGAGNSVSNGILDESPNGLAIDNQSSSFEYGSVMNPAWKGTVANPAIGNGSILFSYESNYKSILFNVTLITGSTTTLGTGDWYFELPFWTNTARKEVGQWAMYRPGLGWLHGAVVCTGVGNPHFVQLLDSASGNYIGAAIPASMPAGTALQISYNYSRG